MSTDLIQRFYSAIAAHDGVTMAACYAPGAHFQDPVFTDLNGDEPGQMWRMLTERADDLEIELVEHAANGDAGSAHWIARYTFRQTGRPVVNDVRAAFRFEDDKIADHRDDFDFTRWARQAIGIAGLLPPVRSAVRRKARAGLDEFIARQS
jgi:ketosteroid isomerase-like protein